MNAILLDVSMPGMDGIAVYEFKPIEPATLVAEVAEVLGWEE